MRTLRLGVVQYTPVFGDKSANLSKLQQLSDDIDADIIVFPELCTTGYFFQSRQEVARVAETAAGETVAFFQELARSHNAVVVAGFPERDGEALYNATCIIVPEEPTPRIYRKMHLFYKELFCFDVGKTGFFVVDDRRRDLRLGTMICYDWRFPESARILTLLGSDLIVCPSNLVTDAWRLVMPARAIENKVYVAVANRAGTEKAGGEELLFKGNSAIYGYNGKYLAQAAATGDEILIADIDPAATRDKSFNAYNNVLVDRQPDQYQELVHPTPLADRKPD